MLPVKIREENCTEKCLRGLRNLNVGYPVNLRGSNIVERQVIFAVTANVNKPELHFLLQVKIT